VQADSLDVDYQERLATIWHREGKVLYNLGENERAQKLFESDLALTRSLVSYDPENHVWQVSLARSLNTLVDFLIDGNELVYASRLSREARTVVAGLNADHPAKISEQINRATMAQAKGEIQASLKLIDKSLDQLDLVDQNHDLLPALYLNLLLLRGVAENHETNNAPAWAKGASFFRQGAESVVGQYFQDLGVRVLFLSGDRAAALSVAEELQATGYARRGFDDFYTEHNLTIQTED